uniref:Uncharacterized protein n=1 Tax=Ananas comosus var. bracteatus TaxID=296719 RepID=A0A6V7NIF2_ANACO|nr:unnamed protein product [Ananas comosus var. bracteatus]
MALSSIPVSNSRSRSPELALMESKSTGCFTLGKQSSLAPDRGGGGELEPVRSEGSNGGGALAEIGAEIRLMYLANEGDMEGIRELLDSGVDVNFRDIGGRTALHVAACQGFADVVELLLERGCADRSEDRWGSTLGFDDHLLLRSLGFISWG